MFNLLSEENEAWAFELFVMCLCLLSMPSLLYFWSLWTSFNTAW